MTCKRCGKALGTDKGVCPWCGAMLTREQMKVFNEEKRHDNRMITEKYGITQPIYQKRENNENKLLGLIIILGVLLVILIIVLLSVLT